MRFSKETSLFQHNAIADDLQGVLQNVSENYTSKSAGVSRSHRIYYRSNSSTKPNPPTTAILGNQAFWVTESGNQYATTGGSSTVMAKWSTKITPMAESTASGSTKYIYLWTCEQYQMADGNYYATAVLVDDSNVVIDGGNLVAGSVTANHIDTSTLTIGDFSDGGEYTKTDNLGNTTAVQNAAKTASNFIEASSSGVKVRNVSYPNNYSLIDANGLTIYKGGVNVANFGDTARVGQSNSSRFLLNSGSLQAYDSSNNLYFQVSANGMTYGVNNTVATQSYVTDQGYQTSNQVNSAISVFVETTGSGIKVRNSLYPNNYALIDSNGLEVYKNIDGTATSVALFGANQATLGGNNAIIKYSEDGSAFGLNNSHRIVVAKSTDEGSGVRNDATLSSREISTWTNTKPMAFVNTTHMVNGSTKTAKAGLYAWGGEGGIDGAAPSYAILVRGNGTGQYPSVDDVPSGYYINAPIVDISGTLTINNVSWASVVSKVDTAVAAIADHDEEIDNLANRTQSGSVAFSQTSSGSYLDKTISFSPSYSAAPTVVAGFQLGTGSTAANFGNCSVAVVSVSATGATLRFYNNSGANKTPTVNWIALG